ncbi:unnamed protein product [Callosobruchus maculatus]|uniref:Uncharacterized protein n=1 Tax=Callosobruchus maculatus TaxID=64391 RepID=A0A653BDD5_CALMS|nr:unnamed protein product [Callosobruchus maculatus]
MPGEGASAGLATGCCPPTMPPLPTGDCTEGDGDCWNICGGPWGPPPCPGNLPPIWSLHHTIFEIELTHHLVLHLVSHSATHLHLARHLSRHLPRHLVRHTSLHLVGQMTWHLVAHLIHARILHLLEAHLVGHLVHHLVAAHWTAVWRHADILGILHKETTEKLYLGHVLYTECYPALVSVWQHLEGRGIKTTNSSVVLDPSGILQIQISHQSLQIQRKCPTSLMEVISFIKLSGDAQLPSNRFVSNTRITLLLIMGQQRLFLVDTRKETQNARNTYADRVLPLTLKLVVGLISLLTVHLQRGGCRVHQALGDADLLIVLTASDKAKKDVEACVIDEDTDLPVLIESNNQTQHKQQLVADIAQKVRMTDKFSSECKDTTIATL